MLKKGYEAVYLALHTRASNVTLLRSFPPALWKLDGDKDIGTEAKFFLIYYFCLRVPSFWTIVTWVSSKQTEFSEFTGTLLQSQQRDK